MSEKKKTVLDLFLTFLKIGAFTFGGGYAMIALLQNEFVTKKEWLSEEEFLDIISVAESTPGPIAVNSSTFIGYKKAGFWGAFFSTLAICIPSFTIIFLISLVFDTFLKITLVAYAFKGISAAVIYLILSAGIKMLKGLKKDVFTRSVFLTVLVLFTAFSIFSIKFSTIYFILISGGFGLIYTALKGALRGKEK